MTKKSMIRWLLAFCLPPDLVLEKTAQFWNLYSHEALKNGSVSFKAKAINFYYDTAVKKKIKKNFKT